MKLDSVCPKCDNINKVENNGKEIMVVTCRGCHQAYDHIAFSKASEAVRDEKLEKLRGMVSDVDYFRFSERTMVCLLIFDNGYEIVGKATVKDPADFKLVVGRDRAYENALERAMVAFGGLL